MAGLGAIDILLAIFAVVARMGGKRFGNCAKL